ncbi:MAG TPA: hypothetical protein VGM90_37300 [Kofleriaceae bacterium]|jgi:hypothetical protein
MMRAIFVASCLSSIVACSSASSTQTGPDGSAPPTIQVTSPARGTFSDTGTVTVTGIVTDDKPGATLKINDQDVTLGSDGSFSAQVAVENGVSIIKSIATDKGGQTARDVRAVMAGTVAIADGSMASPLGARVGTQGFMAIGNALGTTLSAVDIKAVALAMNPVATGSGCNSVRQIDIEDVSTGTIGVGLVPSAGKLTANVDIAQVYVKAHVKFEAVCITGSTTVTMTANVAHVNGDLALSVKNGAISADLPTSSVTLDGFDYDISGVPGFAEDLVKGKVRTAVENALTNVVKDQVPKLANDQLGGLLAKPFNANLLGHMVTLSTTPNTIQLSPDGMFAAVDTKVVVAGGEGGMYISAPQPMTAALMPGTGVGVAIADDTVNQLFSGLWAAGAIDQDVKLEGPLAVLSALLDDDAVSLSISASLPPTVSGEADQLHLAIGDLMLAVKDVNGTEIQNIALSVKTTLAAMPSNGSIALTVGTPELYAQVIQQNAEVDRPMTDEQFEGIVNGAWGLIGGQATNALSGLTLPSLAGVQIGAPSLAGNAGYVVADLPVQ